MDNTKQYQEQQQAKQLHNTVSQFVGDFTVGTLLNKYGIRKLRGTSPLEVLTVIFILPFQGVNFSRWIVNNPELGFDVCQDSCRCDNYLDKHRQIASGQREPKLPSAPRTVRTGPYTAPHVIVLSIHEEGTNHRLYPLTLSFALQPR